MPYKDPLAAKAYRKAYNIKTKLKRQSTSSEYRRLNKDEISARMALYYQDNKGFLKLEARRRWVTYSEVAKRQAILNKQAIIKQYGICPCGESRIGALTIDHLAQDGNIRRKHGEHKGVALYRQIIRDGFPSRYRVLCINCNILAYIAHKETLTYSSKPTAIAARQRNLDRKRHIISQLGGKCVICQKDDINILTVHHVLNNGADHRRQISHGCGGHIFYAALQRLGDLTNLECRCFSCNCNDEWQREL